MPKVYALNMPSRARPVSPPSLGDGVEVWFQDVSEWFRGVVIQGGYGSRSRGHHFNVKFDFDGSTELVDCSGGQWRRPSAGGAAGEDADEADEAGEARGAAAREEAQGAAPLRRADKRCRPPSNLSDSVRSKHLPAHDELLRGLFETCTALYTCTASSWRPEPTTAHRAARPCRTAPSRTSPASAGGRRAQYVRATPGYA